MPRLTIDLLARSTGNATKRRRDESQEVFLARVTHLYCADKGIETIENLLICRRVSVLYLYDNCISKLNGLTACINLTHLYMQNNNIRVLENLNCLHRLTKLYLSHNAISVVEGLTELVNLTELHIAHQRLSEGETLHFDPCSLKAVAPYLSVLNVSGNKLDTIESLSCLTELTHFQATDNHLSSMKELSRVFSQWNNLWKLDLQRNPLASRHKYHDRVVTMCCCLEIFDGREVSKLERQFLFNWKAIRKSRHRYHTKPSGCSFEELLPQRLPMMFTSAPPSMPALPARKPIKLLQSQKKEHLKYSKDGGLQLPLLSTGGNYLTGCKGNAMMQAT